MALFQPDTNIILHYVRDDDMSRRIEDQYKLITGIDQPLISVVIEGEIRTLAEEFGWSPAKRRRMENFLALCIVVPIPFGTIVDSYVRVSEYSRRIGRSIGKNDLWIAATAISTGATLLTTDKDFDHLDPLLLKRHWVDPST